MFFVIWRGKNTTILSKTAVKYRIPFAEMKNILFLSKILFMKIQYYFAALFLSALLITACGDDEKPVDCTGVTPGYTADIAPVLATCAISGCHGDSGTQAGINLTTYENVKTASSNSKFLKAIKHESGAESMPPAGFEKLSDANIKLIECWIKNGKPQ